jgi:hypothetical protein
VGQYHTSGAARCKSATTQPGRVGSLWERKHSQHCGILLCSASSAVPGRGTKPVAGARVTQAGRGRRVVLLGEEHPALRRGPAHGVARGEEAVLQVLVEALLRESEHEHLVVGVGVLDAAVLEDEQGQAGRHGRLEHTLSCVFHHLRFLLLD